MTTRFYPGSEEAALVHPPTGSRGNRKPGKGEEEEEEAAADGLAGVGEWGQGREGRGSMVDWRKK